MKILSTAAKWLFVLSLPVMLLTTSIAVAVNSLWLYKAGFEKYDISHTTGLAEEELQEAATGLIKYFRSGKEYISLTVIKDGEPFELFNQKEIIHLKDVKGLLWLDYRVLLGALIYILGFAGISFFQRKRTYWRRLAWGAVWGGGITLALMLALGLGAVLNFDQLFWQFHLISFTNELWQLDSTKDYLIMLFPQGFWYDTAIFCASITASLAIILGGVAGGYLILTRNRGTSQSAI